MCGIAGIYNFRDNESVSSSLVASMCDRIAYRGPDDSGVYTDGPVGLGHRRLSILDLSEKGHQPMSSADGMIWITYNGEIYNFREVRNELMKKGYDFVSDCDTEVIIYLYQEYGEACLGYLRGMFAFAIWDRRIEKLFLARDRIGKKPLFYHFDGKKLVFASEIKSILEDRRVEKKINYQAFYDYFKYQYVPDPKTIYENIFKLEPGHFITCSGNGLIKREYWDVSFAGTFSDDAGKISGELLGILDQSVALRMISDVPLGAFLSGGIDSSAVVALMARQKREPVTTCSIGFDSNRFDEVEYARIIAERFGTDHHEFTVKEKTAGILGKIAYWFDEPFSDPSAVPTYYVSELARQKVTVALSGDGGDENFAGYEKYHMDDIENRIRRRIPEFIRKPLFPIFAHLLSRGNAAVIRKGRTLLNTLSFESDYGYYLTNSHCEDKIWQALVNDDVKRRIGDYDPFSVTEEYYNRADTDCHLSKILYTDLKSYLPGDILVKVDRMSMANSLEVRAPILDHKVIEMAARIPAAMKYNRGEKKYILKQSFSKILPDGIMQRRKMGFTPPVAQWLRGELKSMAFNRIFARNSGIRHFFNMGFVEKMWEMHQAGSRDWSALLWSLLMFEFWYQAFME